MENVFTVDRSTEAVDAVCKLAGAPELEPFIRHTWALFPAGTVGLARPVYESLLRVAKAVPWLADALGNDPKPELTRLVSLLSARVGYVSRFEATERLTVSLNFAATMVGTESMPMPAAESLRAALWVCLDRWAKAGHEHKTTAELLASRIRGAVASRGVEATKKHPLARLFRAISDAATLPAFLEATRPLLEESTEKGLRRTWIAVDTTLRTQNLPEPAVPEPARAANDERRTEGPAAHEDLEHEAFTDQIHRFTVRPYGAGTVPIRGEPASEIASPEVLAPLDGTIQNTDQRRIAVYHTGQVVWSQNTLLLTCHPDVLTLSIYKKVLSTLIAGIGEERDAEQRAGLTNLLLQGMTGRTASHIAGLQMVDRLTTAPEAPFVVSLREGTLRIRVFFMHATDEPTGYFVPTASEAPYLEPVANTFALPLPKNAIATWRTAGGLGQLGKRTTEELEALTRGAARWVSDRVGLPVTAGQIRKSFSAHLFESCRDLVTTQLICADTLGLSDAPVHYYAPKVSTLASAYAAWARTVGLGDAVDFTPPAGRTGSRLLVKLSAVREMVAAVRVPPRPQGETISKAKAIAIHQAMVQRVVCMFLATAGHRPTNALFKLSLNNIDFENGAALFRDKVHDPAHDPRLVALPTCMVDQLTAYLAHLQVLAQILPPLQRRVRRVLSGEAKLLFGVDPDGRAIALNWPAFSATLPDAWRRVPYNWGRTWIRTHAVELGLPSELVLIELGHLEACGYPFSDASPTEPMNFVATARPYLDKVARLQGWTVARGLDRGRVVGATLLPLQSWQTHLREQDARARKDAEAQRVAERSRLRSNREAALKHVLADQELIAAGIPAAYANKTGPGFRHGITKEVAERIRDRMVADAGDNMALARARAAALRAVLRRVNRRAGMQSQEPAELATFRRPVNNAFVTGMMLAVRQVTALRRHMLESTREPPGDWHDFALACARTTYALALFGFCDDPEQIEGALRHRMQRVRSASVSNLVLVPWGDEPQQSLGLRGLAALALARLAKKYPKNDLPPRANINQALASLLPDWAKGSKSSAECRVENYWSARLCETVAIANRYELSPGARLALDQRGGAVAAHFLEQVALLDGDDAGATRRPWEHEVEAEAPEPKPWASTPRQGNARTQYLALCAAIPSSGQDLRLPLTGQVITADQLEIDGTRPKVIAEIEAQRALTAPAKMLQPIVWALAGWVSDMLKNGTPLRKNPANSTVETYLTRVGGPLVAQFANNSLRDVGDAELEDAYLAAVGCNDQNQDDAARTILQFHAYGVQRLGFPELDLTEVRAYLRSAQRHVDASLILPTERTAAGAWLRARSETAAAAAEDGGRSRVRNERQALAAYPWYGWAGARRSEILGLQFQDIYPDTEGGCTVRIRANRSRRLKTHAARRLIAWPAHSVPTGTEEFQHWVNTDRQRLPAWRHETQFVFAPLESGRDATGRAEIADAIMRALCMATGRPRERLHRLRHLVAFEHVAPIFLAPRDIATLVPTEASRPALAAGIALPRDLAARTIGIGHASPTTTLRCYYHVPWLLRSRADAHLEAVYMTRRGAAAVTGLTLVAVDKVTTQHPTAPPEEAWLNHVIAARIPSRNIAFAAPAVALPSTEWTAVALGQLVKTVARTRQLDKALTLMGARVAEAPAIRQAFWLFERRMGRRVLADKLVTRVGAPKRVIRDMEQAAELEAWLTWLDDASDPTRQNELEALATGAWELMAPGDRDRLPLTTKNADILVRLLLATGIAAPVIQRQLVDPGFEFVRVLRPGGLRRALSTSATTPAERYLGASIKRLLSIIWVAVRLRQHTVVE